MIEISIEYVCVCVCMYVCMFIYIYVCVCVCVYVHTHTHTNCSRDTGLNYERLVKEVQLNDCHLIRNFRLNNLAFQEKCD